MKKLKKVATTLVLIQNLIFCMHENEIDPCAVPSKKIKIWQIEQDAFNLILEHIELTPDQANQLMPLLKKRLLEFPRKTKIDADNIRIFYKVAHCPMIFDALKTCQTKKELNRAMTIHKNCHYDFVLHNLPAMIESPIKQNKNQYQKEDAPVLFKLTVWLMFLDESVLRAVKYQPLDYLDKLGFQRNMAISLRQRTLDNYIMKNKNVINAITNTDKRDELLKSQNYISIASDYSSGRTRNTGNKIFCCLPISCCITYEAYKKCVNLTCQCLDPFKRILDNIGDKVCDCCTKNVIAQCCDNTCTKILNSRPAQTCDTCMGNITTCLCDNPLTKCCADATIFCCFENKISKKLLNVCDYLFCENPVTKYVIECCTCGWE